MQLRAHMNAVTNLAGARTGGERSGASDFFSIRNYALPAGPLVAEIDIYDEIGVDYDPKTGERIGISAQRFLDQVRALPPVSELRLRVCSGGGNVVAALAMYGVLNGLACRKVGVVDGLAASAATIVLAACDSVEMPDGAIIMIHDPEIPCFGNAADFQEAIQTLSRIKDSILAVYAAKNKTMSVEQMSAAMTAKTYFSAQEAVDAGFADVVAARSEVVNALRIDLATLSDAPADFRTFIEGEQARLEAAAAAEAESTEQDMTPEQIAALATATAEAVTAALAKRDEVQAAANQAKQVEQTQAEKDAASLEAIRNSAEKLGVTDIFERFKEGPLEACRNAVFGAAATRTATAPGKAGEVEVKNSGGHGLEGLTGKVVSAWYDKINKRAA